MRERDITSANSGGLYALLPIRTTTHRIAIGCSPNYDPSMDGISVKSPAALESALAAEARGRNVTQSAIVREALERCLPNESSDGVPSRADLVRNVAGFVKSRRRDLASNKALLQATVESGYRRAAKRRR